MSTEANIKVTLAALAPLPQTMVHTQRVSFWKTGGGGVMDVVIFICKPKHVKKALTASLSHSCQKLQRWGSLHAHLRRGQKSVFL